MEKIRIPMDIYESPKEIVIVLPLWWVEKKTINISLEDYSLIVWWKRSCPKLKEDLMPVQQECFWWEFKEKIDLPPNVYFDKIYSKITPDNVLSIVIPKSIKPEAIKIEVDY